MTKKYVLGIDIGFQHTYIAAYQQNNVVLIQNYLNASNKFASSLTFGDNVSLIRGSECSNQINANQKLYGYKLLLKELFNGIKLSDTVTLNAQNSETLTIMKSSLGGVTTGFTFKFLFTLYLQELKEYCEKYLDASVDQVVITVPNYFSKRHKSFILDAARNANLDVLETPSEMVAAAVTFCLNHNFEYFGYLLICDIGNYDLNIAVVEISSKMKFTVKSYFNEPDIGGDCITQMITNYVMNEIKKLNISLSTEKMKKLKSECEHAKKQLSIDLTYTINLDKICQTDKIIKITSTKLDNMCKPYFNKYIQAINYTIGKAKLVKSNIYNAILIGESSKVPKFEKHMNAYFESDKVIKNIQSESIAIGAGIIGFLNQQRSLFNYSEKMCTSIGLGNSSGLMKKLIFKGDTLPLSTTLYENVPLNTTTFFRIFSGEDICIEKNSLIGEMPFKSSNNGKIRISVKVSKQLELTFTIKDDENVKKQVFTIENTHITDRMLYDTIRTTDTFDHIIEKISIRDNTLKVSHRKTVNGIIPSSFYSDKNAIEPTREQVTIQCKPSIDKNHLNYKSSSSKRQGKVQKSHSFVYSSTKHSNKETIEMYIFNLFYKVSKQRKKFIISINETFLNEMNKMISYFYYNLEQLDEDEAFVKFKLYRAKLSTLLPRHVLEAIEKDIYI